MRIAAWKQDLARMQHAWVAISGVRMAPPSVGAWQAALDRVSSEMAELKVRGHWTSEHADLLHVARIADDELIHSNLVAWLLKPTAPHGFGGALLRDLAREFWDLDVPNADAAVVSREVSRDDETGRRRADIIVDVGWITLVVENKVWARESKRQCEDLFRLWTERRKGEVLFLLLSLDGRRPVSTVTDEARSAWRGLSYDWLARWLRSRIMAAPPSLARSTAAQYLAALRPLTKSH